MRRRRRRSGTALALVLGAIGFVAGWLGAGGSAPDWAEPAIAALLASAPAGAQELESPPRPAQVTRGEARLLFVGDILPLEDRDYLTRMCALIAGADLAVGNLECSLSTHGRPTPLKLDARGALLPNEFLFRAPPSQAQRLAAAGVDAVTLANNHAMDFGGEALLETLGALDVAGLAHAGAGPDLRAARQPAIVEVGGLTVALLAYCSERTLPGTDHFAATERTAGVVFACAGEGAAPTPECRTLLRADIRAARAAADFVVVSFHWGDETVDEPTPLARALGRHAVNCGADLVIGHHPHVLQGIELYRGRPIAYSLGNFAFATRWPSNRLSAALEVRVSGGRWRALAVLPVLLDARTGDPAPARGEDARRIVDRMTRLCADLGTPCTPVDEGDGPALAIANSEPPPGERALLRSEERCFRVEAQETLPGMSTVHLLAWDVAQGARVARPRQVTVATGLAAEVLAIFREIYLDPAQFPIDDLVGYDDRTVTGGTGRSQHAFGRAIDLNRAQNPMLRDGEALVHPDEPPYEPGQWRPGEDPYSIAPDGPVVRAFKARGWRWGGDFASCRDYQHFDKPGD